MSSDSPKPPYCSSMVRPNKPISRMPADDVRRVFVGVFEALRVRNDLLVHELANRVENRLLHVAEAGGLS